MDRFAIGMACLTFACASAGGRSDLPVTQDEITGVEAETAHDVLSTLRPRWIPEMVEERKVGVAMTRAEMRALPPEDTRCRFRVYVGRDGHDLGILRRILASSVREIRLLPGTGSRPDGSSKRHT